MRNSLWPELENKPMGRTPEDIIKEQCGFLNMTYADFLCADIRKMDKPLEEYTKSPLTSMPESVSMWAISRPVQSMLGESDEKKLITYELFVTSPKIPTYKYRILFLQHASVPYPSYIYIESAIAKELKFPGEYPAEVSDEKEFAELLSRILGSDRVKEVLSRIISYEAA